MKRQQLYSTIDGKNFFDEDREDISSNELALNRTQLATIRTVLANERTYNAWVRTGISAVLGGLAVAKLLDNLNPDWVPQVIGLLFLLVGTGAFIYGVWRFQSRMTRLVTTENKLVKVYGFWFVNFLLLVSVILVGILLFVD